MSDPFDFNSDPFEDNTPAGLKRDRWDRPLLVRGQLHPEGECKQCDKLRKTGNVDDGRHAYTRASTLASYIENDTHITRWKMRYLARGMATHVDLAILAAQETYNTSFGMPDRDPENSASGKRLDALIDRVLDRMLISQKADYGTAVHKSTEPFDEGFVRDEIKADVMSYHLKCRELGVKIGGTEIFTANDTTMSAGTFDNLKWIPGFGWCITDKKTSSKVDSNHFSIQLAGYANSEIYFPETDERLPLESLTGGEPVNREVGFIFWIKNGRTEVHQLNLVTGWEGAKIAAAARDFNKLKHPGQADANILFEAGEWRRKVTELVGAAESRDELLAIREGYLHLWTDVHTDEAKARLKELAA